MTIAIVSHPDCIQHRAGAGHPEKPERVQVIEKALKTFPFKTPPEFYLAPLATQEQLTRVHTEDHVNWIFSVSPKTGSIALDSDTLMNPHSLTAALRAAGAVVFAVDLVMQDKAQAVFCNVRPPGHHAERQNAMGFCFFNNVAVGVAHAFAQYGIKRVAIVDFDVHHGNGTQDIFQRDNKVLYCSSFQHPFYPGYDAERDNEHIVSVPLKAGTKGKEFREQVKAAWFAKITTFAPELIFFSAGFDAHEQDPLAEIQLTDADYVWLTREIAKIAHKCCKGKMISVLEGGYNLDVLAQCVPAHVNAMCLS